MKAVVMVLSVEAIPFGVLISAVRASPLRRRARFPLRFAAVAVAMLLPDLVAVSGRLGEQAAGMFLWLGFVWGLLLIALCRFVLFHRADPDAGADEDHGEGPDPGDGRPPTPPAPIGGIPLPDAEPSAKRLRDHLPPRGTQRRRRVVRERKRAPSRFWPLRPSPSSRPG